MDIILFNSRDEILRLHLNKIVYFESNGNYTTIYMSNKMKFSTGMNLSQMETVIRERLSGKECYFARVGKSYIINMKYLTLVNVLKRLIVLSDGNMCIYSLEASRDAVKNLKEAVKQIKI